MANNDKQPRAEDSGEHEFVAVADGAVTGASARARSEAPTTATALIEIDDNALLQAFATTGFGHLKDLKAELGVDAGLRGNAIHIKGDPGAVEAARRVVEDLVYALGSGLELKRGELSRALRMIQAHEGLKFRDLIGEQAQLVAGRKKICAKSPAQLNYLKTLQHHDVVFGIGPAGTGKTYLAMAMAVHALNERQVKRIVLTRPAVEAGEKLGFLPGDLAEKVNPYLRPLYDALHDMLDFEKVAALTQRGTIEVAPLAFMRGRTLDDAFVILDEAQNTTIEQMKMFLTRIGFGSKAVITGDATQVDLPTGMRSGLADAVRLLESVQGISVCRFTDVDVVRHPLVQRIVQAYEARDLHQNRPSL